MPSHQQPSSLLPPYARPVTGESATSLAGPVAFRPFVPPTWVGTPGHGVGAVDAGSFGAVSAADPELREAFAEAGSVSLPIADPELREAFAETGEVELPWIDAFAAEPEAEAAAGDALPASEGTAPEETASDDAWAIADAGEHIAHLAEEISAAGSESHAASSTAETHQPWQDDEAWMDIMPALPNTGANNAAAEVAWARAFAEPPAPLVPPAPPVGDAQAAAASLEAVARRLRAGDLSVPGFHADRGDAAALAAALASILGARG